MNKIESIELISINILKTSLDSIDNNKFIKEMNSSEVQTEENYIKNKNHSYYEDQKFPFGKPESEKLIKEINKAVNIAVGKEMEMSDIWTLTLENNQSVSAHSHKINTVANQEEHYSIAYYPSAPEGSADLIFFVTACNTIEKGITIKIETGSLIIFNSYLMHMTNRHKNPNENRIVVSANLHPKNPKIKSNQDWSGYKK